MKIFSLQYPIAASLLIAGTHILGARAVAQGTGDVRAQSQAQADQFKTHFLTTCGGRNFSAVTSRMESCGDAQRGNKVCRIYTEYSTVRFSPVAPDPNFSEADQLNGIQFDGIMAMYYKADRYRTSLDGHWTEWKDWTNATGPLLFRFWEKANRWHGLQIGGQSITLGSIMGSSAKYPDPWPNEMSPTAPV